MDDVMPEVNPCPVSCCIFLVEFLALIPDPAFALLRELQVLSCFYCFPCSL
jgi:hypothetical protein